MTAHAGEGGPAAYLRSALDALGVKRIDHGHPVMDGPALVARCRDDGILFTCCPSTTRYTTGWKDLTALDHPVRRMKEAGLAVTIHSDDPPFFHTTLAREYEVAHRDLGFSLDKIKASILAGLQGAWLPAGERAALATAWAWEIDPVFAEAV